MSTATVMPHRFSALLFVLGATALLAVALCAPLARANEAPPSLDAKMGQKINRAVEQLHAGRYDEARALLEALASRRLSPYERARVESILAAVAQSQGRYGEAREHLRKAIDSGGMNDQEISSARFDTAQLFLAEERWQEGADALNAWFASGAKPNSNAYYLLAVAYYQLKQYDAALEPAQKAVDMAEAPQENWLQLLLTLRIERQEYGQAAAVVRRLLSIAPAKKVYWVQLSGVYGATEKYMEALTPLQLAYLGGLLTEPAEYRRLVDLLMFVNIPHRAALVLSKALAEKKVGGDVKDWEKLGNAWLAAREFDKAVGPLERAARLSEDGNLYIRLAEIHLQGEDWEMAIEALRRALEKGKLKGHEDAHLLMGVALCGQKKLKEARSYFRRAAQSPKNRAQAEGWLRYIDIELRT